MNDYKNCKSNGCLRRFMSFTTDAENAEQLINAWNEFRSYLRKVYAKPPVKAVRWDSNALDDNPRLNEIIKW